MYIYTCPAGRLSRGVARGVALDSGKYEPQDDLNSTMLPTLSISHNVLHCQNPSKQTSTCFSQVGFGVADA